MLSNIIKLLKERGPMSLGELARSSQMDVSAMEGMLSMLTAKGRIEEIGTKCGSCKGCLEVKSEDVMIYRLVAPITLGTLTR